MIFFTYLSRKLFSYFFGAALFLTLLFNIVEFFEKLAKVGASHSSTAGYFILLRLLPSFVELLPLASWLSAILVIRELYQSTQWHTMPRLMIKKRDVCFIFLIYGSFAALGSLVLNELCVIPLSAQAEKYRAKHFKKIIKSEIHNKTMFLPQNIFCHISFLDTKTNLGTGLTLLQLSHDLRIKELYQIERFSLDEQNQQIHLSKGILFTQPTYHKTIIEGLNFPSPSFFSSLATTHDLPTLTSLLGKVMLYKNLLTTESYHHLLELLIQRFFFYAQILLLPVLTLIFFYAFCRYEYWRWIALLCSYTLGITMQHLVIESTINYSYWILIAFITTLIMSIVYKSLVAIKKP